MTADLGTPVLVFTDQPIKYSFTESGGVLLEQEGVAGYPDDIIELASRDEVLKLALELMRLFYQWVDMQP